MPTVLALTARSWADLAPVAPALLAAVAFVILALRRERRARRHARELAARSKPRAGAAPAGGMPPWIWIFLITVGVVVGYMSSGRPSPPRRIADPVVTPSSAWVWMTLLGPSLGLGGLIGFLVWRRRRNPIVRAVKLANAGDIPGAVALIEARIAARRRAVAPAPAAAGEYAPPAGLINPAAKRALADDVNVLGVLEGARGDWLAALARYEEADALVEGSVPIFRSNRGIALVKLGRADAGLALLDEAVADLPPDDHANRFQILRQAGDALGGLGRLDEARARLDEAEAACRRVAVLWPGARKPWLAQIAQVRARLDAAEMPPAAPREPAP